ncbi:UNVERIFIED_CONTAM: hypothetical protein PYX00_003200 [Menopon gallinae]|uniref:RNA helicase n=1 Tax=Menopon gallinae TaxID=328185 RepID=A0AAW2HZH5_9NEOP
MESMFIKPLTFKRSTVIMRRFNPGYRKKAGNCNKLYRQIRDESASEADDSSGYRAGGYRTSNSRSYNTFNRNNWGRSSPHKHKESKPTGGKRFSEGRDFSRNLEGSAGGTSYTKIERPPGLKGKEIGLWYKERSKLRAESGANKNKEIENLMTVTLDERAQDFITNVLKETESHHFATGQESLGVGANIETYATFEEKIDQAKVNENWNDEGLNKRLYIDMLKKMDDKNYKSMCSFRERLPVFKKKDEILQAIKENQVVVISGGTGCGKTTQIVQYVLDDYILNKKGSLCSIVCTQPRRITTITVAERVAAERVEEIGETVGYQIRLENHKTPREKGCINFMTTGVLINWLGNRPILDNISHLFVDEVHERNVDCDFLLAIMKYIMPKRPDLKLILMSASLNSSSFVRYFQNVPCIEIPGLTYPVEEIFLESVLEKTKFEFPETRKPIVDPDFTNYVLPYIRRLQSIGQYSRFVMRQLQNPLSEVLNISLAEQVVKYICMREKEGAILVFLPGLSDINNLRREILESRWYSPELHIVIPIHSILPTCQQKQAFAKPPPGVRKIVIATSILETSITIDDIVFVVDCGKNKNSGYDIKAKVATLNEAWISQANAKQRAGRAGRTQPGKCYKLYTKVRQEILDKFPTPEIKTTSLERVILQAKLLQLGKVAPFLERLMDPPDPEMVELSLKELRNLNALDSEERLTPLGYHLSKLPLDPRTGKMLLMAAMFSCIDPVFSAAACLSFKEPFLVPLGQEDAVYEVKKSLWAHGEKSDHFVFIEAMKKWEEMRGLGRGHAFCHSSFLSHTTLELLNGMKRQFAEILFSMNFLASSNTKDPRSNYNSENKELIKAVICAGLYPNVAYLKKMKGGKNPVALLRTLDHKSVLFHMRSYCSRINEFESLYFVYHQIMKTSSVFLHDATMMQPMPLIFFGEALDSSKKKDQYYVKVNEIIKFATNKETIDVVQELKSRLDWILESTISKPEPFDWHTNDEKTKILSAIVTLMTSASQDMEVPTSSYDFAHAVS